MLRFCIEVITHSTIVSLSDMLINVYAYQPFSYAMMIIFGVSVAQNNGAQIFACLLALTCSYYEQVLY